MSGDIGALRVFAAFLAAQTGPASNEAAITRAVIEDYLLSLASSGRAPATRIGLLVAIKIFLDHRRRHRTGARPGRRRPSRLCARARHVPRGGPAQGAHPLIGDLEVVDPHIQVKLLRWPLVRPAGRAVIGDLLKHQASEVSAMSTQSALSCTRSQSRTAAQNRADMSASGQSTRMFISWPTGGFTPGFVQVSGWFEVSRGPI